MALQTEFDFELPKGYLDDQGDLHRRGSMRLATAADEILPLKDPRVQGNPSYLTIILLSRVVTGLGTLKDINPRIIEGLYVEDLAYLQDFYNKINGGGQFTVKGECPHCNEEMEVTTSPGESLATLSIASTRR